MAEHQTPQTAAPSNVSPSTALANQSERLAQAAEKARAAAAKGVDERLAAKDKQVADYYARKENEQPTPTQRENDLAKVGALDIDDKEDDGGETEGEMQRRVLEGNLNNAYQTRQMDGDRQRRTSNKAKAR